MLEAPIDRGWRETAPCSFRVWRRDWTVGAGATLFCVISGVGKASRRSRARGVTDEDARAPLGFESIARSANEWIEEMMEVVYPPGIEDSNPLGRWLLTQVVDDFL